MVSAHVIVILDFFCRFSYFVALLEEKGTKSVKFMNQNSNQLVSAVIRKYNSSWS